MLPDEVGTLRFFFIRSIFCITGENLHVDAGYNIVGMKAEDALILTLLPAEKSEKYGTITSRKRVSYILGADS